MNHVHKMRHATRTRAIDAHAERTLACKKPRRAPETRSGLLYAPPGEARPSRNSHFLLRPPVFPWRVSREALRHTTRAVSRARCSRSDCRSVAVCRLPMPPRAKRARTAAAQPSAPASAAAPPPGAAALQAAAQQFPEAALRLVVAALAGDPATLCAAACVSKAWNAACAAPELWSSLCFDARGAARLDDAVLARLVKRAGDDLTELDLSGARGCAVTVRGVLVALEGAPLRSLKRLVLRGVRTVAMDTAGDGLHFSVYRSLKSKCVRFFLFSPDARALRDSRVCPGLTESGNDCGRLWYDEYDLSCCDSILCAVCVDNM